MNAVTEKATEHLHVIAEAARAGNQKAWDVLEEVEAYVMSRVLKDEQGRNE